MSRCGSIFRVLCLGGVLALIAGTANAEINLKGQGASDSFIPETLTLSDGSSCSGSFSGSVSFLARHKFSATDSDRGKTYTGKYKQKGAGGRTIIMTLDKKSKRAIKNALKEGVADCTGASTVTASVNSYSVKGKINKSKTVLKVNAKIKGTGRADGESGAATYSFKLKGPLTR